MYKVYEAGRQLEGTGTFHQANEAIMRRSIMLQGKSLADDNVSLIIGDSARDPYGSFGKL